MKNNMKSITAFIQKELIEQIRTYKLLIIFASFFILGMMSPLLAKLMPDILSNIDMEGITIIVPETTAFDAYSQFFGNMTEMGIVIVLLVFGGVLSNEFSRGTLINILAKGFPRSAVILSKFLAAVLLFSSSYIMACVVNQAYTAYLFEEAGVKNVVFSMLCLWLFVVFILSLILLSSTLTTGSFGGLILTSIILVVMLIINAFPIIKDYNPIYLASNNMGLITGAVNREDTLQPIIITIILTIACLYGSILLFKKKKM